MLLVVFFIRFAIFAVGDDGTMIGYIVCYLGSVVVLLVFFFKNNSLLVCKKMNMCALSMCFVAGEHEERVQDSSSCHEYSWSR